MGEQSVSAAEIDDASSPKEPAHPPRHLPGFIQFFARQTPRVAHGTGEAMKEPVARKATEVPIGQSSPVRR